MTGKRKAKKNPTHRQPRVSIPRERLTRYQRYDWSDRLVSLRERRGLTQKKLAEISGVAQALISRYERGLMPNPYNERLLILALGHDISTWPMPRDKYGHLPPIDVKFDDRKFEIVVDKRVEGVRPMRFVVEVEAGEDANKVCQEAVESILAQALTTSWRELPSDTRPVASDTRAD